jgi:hypothetical protein
MKMVNCKLRIGLLLINVNFNILFNKTFVDYSSVYNSVNYDSNSSTFLKLAYSKIKSSFELFEAAIWIVLANLI